MSSVLTAAENFIVVVYKRGSTANGAQSGTLTSITVRNGALRWANGNKGMVGISPARYFTVSGTPANDTTIPINAVSLSILDGERLVNLGTDTGSSSPNFDGSGVSIYSVNSDAATAISQSRVTTDGHGEYAYYAAVGLSAVDELILSSTTPVELIEDVPVEPPHRTTSPEVDGTTVSANISDTERAYVNATARIHSFRTGGAEQSYILQDGTFVGDVDAGTITASSSGQFGDLSVGGTSNLQGPIIAGDALDVAGATTLAGALTAASGATVTTLTATANTSLQDLTATGITSSGGFTMSNVAGTADIRAFLRVASNVAGFGGFAEIYSATEELSLVGLSVKDSTANLLPANSIILAVAARVTSTIATATDWAVGDPTTPLRFSLANATLTAGTTSVGLNQWDPTLAVDTAHGPQQVAAAKVRVDVTGTASTGRVRITVFYITFVPPTS